MKKQILTAAIALALGTGILTAMSGCENFVVDNAVDGNASDEHVHTFASEWTSDGTHHWHAATCEHTSEVSDKSEHTYGEDGKCTACQKSKPIAQTILTEEEWNNAVKWINVGNFTQTIKNYDPDLMYSVFSNPTRIITVKENIVYLSKYGESGPYEEWCELLDNDVLNIYELRNGELDVMQAEMSRDGVIADIADDDISLEKILHGEFSSAEFNSESGKFELQLDKKLVESYNSKSNGTVYSGNITVEFKDGKLAAASGSLSVQWANRSRYENANGEVTGYGEWVFGDAVAVELEFTTADIAVSMPPVAE